MSRTASPRRPAEAARSGRSWRRTSCRSRCRTRGASRATGRNSMPRVPIIGGNWKMNTTRDEARALLEGLHDLDGLEGAQVVICPPAAWLGDAADILAGTTL